MIPYIGRRLLTLFPIIIGITFLSFLLMHSVSGDAIDMMYERIGSTISQEALMEKKEQLGLDQSFITQYISWLFGLVTGDLGVSYVSGKDVFATFADKIPRTILLTFAAVLYTFCLAVPLGIVAAVHRGQWADHLIRFFSFLGNAIPGFFLSLLLILLFSVKWGILSPIGTEGIKSLILPTLTLGTVMAAKYTRQVRAAVLEELNKDYVLAAQARGVKNKTILYKSVLKTAMLTMLTLAAMSIGSLLGGTAIVETIFLWDGVGKLVVDAVTMRDYPMIQAYVVYMAVIYVLINLIADLLHHQLDPKIMANIDSGKRSVEKRVWKKS